MQTLEGQGTVRAGPQVSLPFDDLARAITERMALVPGERVLVLGTHGRFEPLVQPLEAAIREAGGEVWGSWAARAGSGGGTEVTPFEGVLDGPIEKLMERLADVDVGVMLPGAEATDPAYAAMQRNLEELGGPRRTIHFHWAGAYDLENRLLQPDPVTDAVYVDALLNTDYPDLAAVQAAWIQRARRGQIRVTTPAGTDIRFRIRDRPVTRQDGDASAGRALSARNLIDREIELPAGAIRVAPIEETVGGVIVFPPMVFAGQVVEGLRMWFERGELSRFEARTGREAVEEELSDGGRAARSFRELALGFNPHLAVRWHTGRGERWIPYYGYGEGVVRLSLGDNTELGGAVSGGYVRWNFFTDATVELIPR